MAFFDELEQMVTQTSDRLSQIAKEMVDQSQFSREKAQLQYQLDQLYRDLGKTVYRNAAEDAAEDVSGKIEEIRTLIGTLEAKEKEYYKAKGVILCSNCGKEVDPGYAFCPACGQKVEAAEPAKEDAPEAQPEEPVAPASEETAETADSGETAE